MYTALLLIVLLWSHYHDLVDFYAKFTLVLQGYSFAQGNRFVWLSLSNEVTLKNMADIHERHEV